MPCRQELLDSIEPGMKLTKGCFLKIYGYEISFPGFAGTALSALEKAGSSKAREYYRQFVGEYDKKHDEEMKRAAEWYKKQFDRKGDDKSWKKTQEAEPVKISRERVAREILKW